jgi:hypothetical protein
MERLSIASFLANGHEYHLYTYGDVDNVPRPVVWKDAAGILPEAMIFQYEKHASYSAFSNFFRYKLLLERGGWWADLDTICVKPFDFSQRYVFSSELANGKQYVNCGVVKAPEGSAAMAYAWSVCSSKERSKLVWGEVGPRLLAESVARHSLESFVMPANVFCPLGYGEWEEVLSPEKVWSFDDETRAVHLWNEMWRRGGRDKNGTYPERCLYERLKRAYLS